MPQDYLLPGIQKKSSRPDGICTQGKRKLIPLDTFQRDLGDNTLNCILI